MCGWPWNKATHGYLHGFLLIRNVHRWKSWVEIENYSIAYFKCITRLEIAVLPLKVGAHTCFIDASDSASQQMKYHAQ